MKKYLTVLVVFLIFGNVNAGAKFNKYLYSSNVMIKSRELRNLRNTYSKEFPQYKKKIFKITTQSGVSVSDIRKQLYNFKIKLQKKQFLEYEQAKKALAEKLKAEEIAAPNPIKGFRRWILGEKLSSDDMLSGRIRTKHFSKYYETSSNNFSSIKISFNIETGVIYRIGLTSKPFPHNSDKSSVFFHKVIKTYKYKFKNSKYMHQHNLPGFCYLFAQRFVQGNREIEVTRNIPPIMHLLRGGNNAKTIARDNIALEKYHRQKIDYVFIMIMDKKLNDEGVSACLRKENHAEKCLDL
jgi:hypothetical protein